MIARDFEVNLTTDVTPKKIIFYRCPTEKYIQIQYHFEI